MTDRERAEKVLREADTMHGPDLFDIERAIADARSAGYAEAMERSVPLVRSVLDRLRSTDGYTTLGSIYDEDFAGAIAQLRALIEEKP